MLLPAGEGVQKELNTSYTQFDQLLHDLYESRFCGYLRISFWGFEGLLILDSGRVIQGSTSEREFYLVGEQAVLRILNKVTEKDGVIEMIPLSNEVAVALGFAIQAVLHEDNAILQKATLNDVFQFIANENISGYLDIEFHGQKGHGTVYYLEGQPVDAIIRAPSGKVAGGQAVMAKMLEISEKIHPDVQLYYTSGQPKIIEEYAFLLPWVHGRYFEFLNAVLSIFKHFIKEGIVRRKTFADYLQEAMDQLQQEYPFFRPQNEIVLLKNNVLHLNKILHHKTFLLGFTELVRHILQRVPGRRLKKLDQEQLFDQLLALSEQYEIPREQFNVANFMVNLFEGQI